MQEGSIFCLLMFSYSKSDKEKCDYADASGPCWMNFRDFYVLYFARVAFTPKLKRCFSYKLGSKSNSSNTHMNA